MKIAHLTSVHPRGDTRIFVKECCSLVSSGFDVTLVVADSRGSDLRQGVKIVDVGKPRGRWQRVVGTTRSILDCACKLDADLFHLHDPELIPVGLQLKRLGRKVVFDSHEDVPKQLLAKPYLGPLSSRTVSLVFARFERYACAQFDGIIAATPFIRDKFLSINPTTIDVNNFPVSSEIGPCSHWESKRDEVCYIGAIGVIRGIREIVRAFEHVREPVRLNLGGRFSEIEVEQEVKAYPQWARVNELGYLDREGVCKTLARSMAGLVTLLPTINYLDALPVKMFEYMAAGIPVISSNFPLWRDIVETSDCGLCVNPLDPREIAAAIDHLTGDPELARRLGQNGRKAVLDRYNWAIEEKKLLRFYESIL